MAFHLLFPQAKTEVETVFKRVTRKIAGPPLTFQPLEAPSLPQQVPEGE